MDFRGFACVDVDLKREEYALERNATADESLGALQNDTNMVSSVFIFTMVTRLIPHAARYVPVL